MTNQRVLSTLIGSKSIANKQQKEGCTLNYSIIVPGPLVENDRVYLTNEGELTRSQLKEKFAGTVQSALTNFVSCDYTPHKAGELILRSVLAMLNKDMVTGSQKYVVTKLSRGLGILGYQLIEKTDKPKPERIITFPKFETFPRVNEVTYYDQHDSQKVYFDEIPIYLKALDSSLEETDAFAADHSIRLLVRAVNLLVNRNIYHHEREIEQLLWDACDALGFHLSIADWYKESPE